MTTNKHNDTSTSAASDHDLLVTAIDDFLKEQDEQRAILLRLEQRPVVDMAVVTRHMVEIVDAVDRLSQIVLKPVVRRRWPGRLGWLSAGVVLGVALLYGVLVWQQIQRVEISKQRTTPPTTMSPGVPGKGSDAHEPPGCACLGSEPVNESTNRTATARERIHSREWIRSLAVAVLLGAEVRQPLTA